MTNNDENIWKELEEEMKEIYKEWFEDLVLILYECDFDENVKEEWYLCFKEYEYPIKITKINGHLIKVIGRFYHTLLVSLYYCLKNYLKERLYEKYFAPAGIYRCKVYVMSKSFVYRNICKITIWDINETLKDIENLVLQSLNQAKGEVYVYEVEIEPLECKVSLNRTIGLNLAVKGHTVTYALLNQHNIEEFNEFEIIFKEMKLNGLKDKDCQELLDILEHLKIDWITLFGKDIYQISNKILQIIGLRKFRDLKFFNNFREVVEKLARFYLV